VVEHSSDQRRHPAPIERHLPWMLAGIGIAGLAAATAVSPTDARAAASQDWSPFVLVTGLLLIGLVADDDGLFAAAGHQLARMSNGGVCCFWVPPPLSLW
jgi:Na+/H+ antiporter NhaD/arsenite permease-like protein